MRHTDTSTLSPRDRAYLYMGLALYQGVGAVIDKEPYMRFTPLMQWTKSSTAVYRKVVRKWWLNRPLPYDPHIENVLYSAHQEPALG